MVSEKQTKLIIERLKLEFSYLNSCSNIEQLSIITGIPRSTIQRDLNNIELINVNLGLDSLKIIKTWLQEAKKQGLSNGGKKSQEIHGFEKDELGHFKGSKK